MKRELDLYRDILLLTEKYADPNEGPIQILAAGNQMRFPGVDDVDLPESIEGTDNAVILRHVELMTEAGLLDSNANDPSANTTTDGRLFNGAIYGLTHEGHDFLENIRDDTVWNRTKEETRSFALDVVKATAEGIIKASMGL